MSAKFTADDARAYIARVRWQFAKTMPLWPHEYTVREWRPELEPQFFEFVELIRREGVVKPWPREAPKPRYHLTYLEIDGWEYWTMGAPLSETTVINRANEIRLWLDDDLIDRAAPEGWVHVTTASEAIRLLDTRRVVELSLDHDLGDDDRFGRGIDVVDWLAEQQEVHDRPLWPRDGITIHSANAYGRDAMVRAIENYAGKRLQVRRSLTAGGKPRLTFSRLEP